MNEASVSSPFMTALRKRLPDAVVVKHHDASMIGLPDCSVTYRGRVFWIEFKLFVPTKKWDGLLYVQKIASESPTQYEMCKRLDRAATCFYLVWVKKGRRIVLWPASSSVVAYTFETETTSEMVEYFAKYLENICSELWPR